MFIGCENSSGYPDYYYIENIETLEELQEYIQNKMPIIGYKVEYKYKNSAVLKENTYKGLVYLNNYLNIFKAYLYFIEPEQLDRLDEKRCKICTKNNNMFGCMSKYKPDVEKLCANYDEPKSKIKKKWYKLCR